eukprot:3938334-Lingulodinium_polyedra.AAC.1
MALALLVFVGAKYSTSSSAKFQAILFIHGQFLEDNLYQALVGAVGPAHQFAEVWDEFPAFRVI